MDMVDTGYVEAGRLIRRRREYLEMTQNDVVEALSQEGIQTSTQTISRLESGGGRLSYGDPEFVNALARVLHCDVEDLLAAIGYLKPRELRLDTRTQRFMELASKLDPDALDDAEQILKVLVASKKKRKQG
jgi:transcriptional regulator with XRE-family HTH domain